MKKFCKQLYNNCRLFLQSVVSVMSVFLFSSRKAAKRIKMLQKTNKKNSCVILGNGPSLKNSIKGKEVAFSDMDTVAVNLFCTTDAFQAIKPKYYVLTDPAFFDDNVTEERVKQEQTKLKEGLSLVDWRMILFLPSINKNSKMTEQLANSNVEVFYYNLTPLEGFLSLQHAYFKRNLGMPTAMNVLCAAIFLMINVGYKKIYLLGADHSWLSSFFINDDNEVILGDKHFYGDQTIKCPYSLSKWLYNQHVGFKSHERLEEYARYRNVEVLNATKGSYIDAYKREYIID